MIRFHKAALLGLSVVATPVAAQQLVYTPVNPAFGGNPFNSTQMLALANAQNQFLPKQQSIQAPTQAELFASQLQSTILAGVAQQISNAIFGTTRSSPGRFRSAARL